MAFTASSVKTRYQAAGNIPVLKSDFTSICSDLVSMQSFMKTGVSDAGKFTTLSSDAVSTGSITISSSTISVNGTAWPAGILLKDINTGSRASTTNGKWATLFLDDTVRPGTNISISHLKSTNGTVSVQSTESFVNGFNSDTTRVRISVPSSIESDGGNNFKYYLWAQTASVSGTNLGSCDMGVSVTIGAKLIGGATFHCPIFSYFGSNATGATVTYVSAIKIYKIDEL